MAIKLQQEHRKRLALVKQLYGVAGVQANARHSALNRIMAVIGFDLAVETTVRQVMSLKPDTKADKESNFPKAIQEASDYMTVSGLGNFPLETAIKRCHEIRNDAQHNGRVPSVEEAENCRNTAREFLDEILFQVWAVRLHDISNADLINDARCRTFLERAEAALANGLLLDAVGNAGAGLKVALRSAERKIYPYEHYGRVQPDAIMISNAIGANQDFNPFDKYNYGFSQALVQQINQMKFAVIFASVSLNFFDYLNVSRIIGEITLRGEVEFERRNGKDDLTFDDVDYVVSYSVNTAIQLESALSPP